MLHDYPPAVIRVPLGFCLGARVVVPFVNAYLIPVAGGWALVDTGPPGCEGAVLKALSRHGIVPESVRWIVITHGHFDHVGSAPALRRHLPHARILMHPADRPLVEGGWPRGLRAGGWRSVVPALLSRTLGPVLARAGGLRPWPPELVAEVVWLDGLEESETPTDLRALGIEASALLTPGHSAGSFSILLPGGEMLTGDVVQAAVLVEDETALRRSHRRIAACGPKRLYRGHGRPAGGEVMERMLKAGRLDSPY